MGHFVTILHSYLKDSREICKLIVKSGAWGSVAVKALHY